MSGNLIDFTINNPKKQGLDNIMGYNASDLFYFKFKSIVPKNADCSNNFFMDVDNLVDASFNKTIDCSNNPLYDYTNTDIKTTYDEGEFCKKRALCENKINHRKYLAMTGSVPGGYAGSDVVFTDTSQLYNFNIVTTTNLSLGILLIGVTIYSYMY